MVIRFEPDLDEALSNFARCQVRAHVAQFPQLVLGVESHRFDIAVDGVSDSPAREKIMDVVDYGQAYWSSSQRRAVLLVRLPLRRFTAQLGYAQGTYGQQTATDVTAFCKHDHLAEPKVVQFPERPIDPVSLGIGTCRLLALAISWRAPPLGDGMHCSPMAR
jgi:hypothetical protein